jgi:hypothetical protein
MASHDALRRPGTTARSASAGPSARPTRAAHGPAGSLARLQRAIGNRATGQLIQRCRDGHTCAECAQRASPWDEGLTQAPGQRQGVGQPLDPAVRTFTESAFGADFGDVRVHTDAHAAATARGLHALAYTIGRDIFFEAGRYQPTQREGQRLLAHELTHVLQQRGAPGGIQPATGLASSADDRLERQADEQATRVLAGRALNPAPIAGQLGVVRVQRQSLPPPVSGPPPLTTSCSPGEVAMLTIHLAHARAWVNEAESKIRAFATGKLSRAEAAIVIKALMDNFHTSTLADVGIILANVVSLKNALSVSPAFECVDALCTLVGWIEGVEPYAYVSGMSARARRTNAISVCPTWFGEPSFVERVTGLIHERAHQYPGARDQAYNHEDEYVFLSPHEAIENAESYAIAARQIFHGGAHGPQKHSMTGGPSLEKVLRP